MAYANRTQLTQLGLQSAALTDVTATVQDENLDAASALADSYLASRYTLPLISWGDDLIRAVCVIAAWDILAGTRGFDPEALGDQAVRMRYEDIIKWLEAIAAGDVTPSGIVDSSTAASPMVAAAWSDTERGW